jgi:hypothetical protein
MKKLVLTLLGGAGLVAVAAFVFYRALPRLLR